MSGRTFFRILIENLFINNALCKAIFLLVKFCKEQSLFYKKRLKFSKKMPLNKIDDSAYQSKFIFNVNQNSGVNFK